MTFLAATLRDFDGRPTTVEAVYRAWEAILLHHGGSNYSLVREALSIQAKVEMQTVRHLFPPV